MTDVFKKSDMQERFSWGATATCSNVNLHFPSMCKHAYCSHCGPKTSNRSEKSMFQPHKYAEE